MKRSTFGVRDQGHTRQKIDLEAGGRTHNSRSTQPSSFLVLNETEAKLLNNG